MSAMRSTPTTTPARSHPVGFNQLYYDPFFPSSTNEEQLVPIKTERSPSLKSNDGRAQRPSSPLNPHSQDGSSYNGPTSPRSHLDQDHGKPSYGFLSPNHYISDVEYNGSSEHTATPEYDGFYLEDKYGMLEHPPDSAGLSDPAISQDSSLGRDSADADIARLSSDTHRASIGAATLSSHLMSPVLTEAPDPLSRAGSVSPPPDVPRTKPEGTLHTAPPAVRIDTVQQASLNPNICNLLQQTPTTTNPDGTGQETAYSGGQISREMSPVIRVEKYAGGDSPDLDQGAGWISGKRSRPGSSSSHLAVQSDDSPEDGDEDQDHLDKRSGLDPNSRFQLSNVEIPNLKDQEETKKRASKKADVEDWLGRSASSSEGGADLAPEKPKEPGRRQRARSAGAQSLSQANLECLRTVRADSHVPGPGILIDEESGEDDSEMNDDDEIASIDESPPPTTALGDEVNSVPGEAKPGVYDELPDQPLLYRAKLWHDPLYDSTDPGVRMQPVSSNDAIVRFEQRAGDMETLSRVATWGTRRMSESDLEGLFHRLSFSNDKTVEPAKRKRERSASFIREAAAKLVQRSSFSLRRRESDNKKRASPPRPILLEHNRTVSMESRSENLMVPQSAPRGLPRMSSLGKRPKSPRINTGTAVAAMASQMAALGSASVATSACSSPSSPWTMTKNILRRARSRSDVNNLPSPGGCSSATEPGVSEASSRQIGTPMPRLVTPNSEAPSQYGGCDEDEEDDGVDDVGITMDLSIKPDDTVPTLEGFKANIRQLNPRLPPFMFDRIAHEQLRRFKKLVDFKIKHVQAVSSGKCPSGKHCIELGGEPTYLPPKSSNRDSNVAHSGFAVTSVGPSDDDANESAEGLVTPAQFPAGVPLPPVKRLPAEFECTLCFKVKKFLKPSDWSKHVHEDVQPFTCTFAVCAEPKSFKRKADWVRHENERHRQLEWWRCSMYDCSHKCYRKDNFVQHLVREHKLPEPKVKTGKAGKRAVRGPSSQKARKSKQSDHPDDSNDEIGQVWKLVEECRHETRKDPSDEPCTFCGNVCNSWKKLTVHLGTHMEQISMPVLAAVNEKHVTPDTVLSPIEQRIDPHEESMSPSVAHSPLPQDSPVSPHGTPMSSMAEVPGGLTSVQSQQSYFPNTPDSQTTSFSRPSPGTYPPPSHGPQLAPGYVQRRGSPYPISEYGSYSGASTPSFNPINAPRSYPNTSPSSPEERYATLRAPTSNPRPGNYDDGNGYQYVGPQSSFVASPVEGSVYQFPNSPTSYPQHRTPAASYPPHPPIGTPSPTFSPQPLQMGGQMSAPYDHARDDPRADEQSNEHNQQQRPDRYAYQQ